MTFYEIIVFFHVEENEAFIYDEAPRIGGTPPGLSIKGGGLGSIPIKARMV
jgi:hypothetical protein